MEEQIEHSLASDAFAVFANRIAAELAEENKLLEAELERLQPVRDQLGSVELHVNVDDRFTSSNLVALLES